MNLLGQHREDNRRIRRPGKHQRRTGEAWRESEVPARAVRMIYQQRPSTHPGPGTGSRCERDRTGTRAVRAERPTGMAHLGIVRKPSKSVIKRHPRMLCTTQISTSSTFHEVATIFEQNLNPWTMDTKVKKCPTTQGELLVPMNRL